MLRPAVSGSTVSATRHGSDRAVWRGVTGTVDVAVRVPPPTVAAREKLVHVISKRVGCALERQGLLVRDVENSFLTLDPIEMVVSPDVV